VRAAARAEGHVVLQPPVRRSCSAAPRWIGR
jgi:hypothetical protein